MMTCRRFEQEWPECDTLILDDFDFSDTSVETLERMAKRHRCLVLIHSGTRPDERMAYARSIATHEFSVLEHMDPEFVACMRDNATNMETLRADYR